jgi:hypothetical protein
MECESKQKMTSLLQLLLLCRSVCLACCLPSHASQRHWQAMALPSDCYCCCCCCWRMAVRHLLLLILYSYA